MFRYCGPARRARLGDVALDNDDSQPDDFTIDAYSAVVNTTGCSGTRAEPDHGARSTMWTTSPTCGAGPADCTTRGTSRTSTSSNLASISLPVTTGAGGDAGTLADRYVFQIKDDVSLLKGNHALKIGVNFDRLHHLGILNGNEHFATFALLRRPVGDLQQHQWPGTAGLPDARHRPAVAAGQRRAVNGDGYGRIPSTRRTSSDLVQDDWRATSRLTLNLACATTSI